MSCCKVNRCCCCLEHRFGVKLLALFLILLEVLYVVLAIELRPRFATFVGVACSLGVVSHLLLLVAVYKVSRWFCIPWMIYIMLVVVGLCLASVLQVVIPLGASNQEPDWLSIVIFSSGCLALAGLYLYFWIVVLELFIKLGPLYYTVPVPTGMYLPPPPPSSGNTIQQQQRQQQQAMHASFDLGAGPPHSLFVANSNQVIYQRHNQPSSLPIFYPGQKVMIPEELASRKVQH